MRLGVVVLPEMTWSEAAGVWRDIEAMGFEHAWTYDHLAWRNLRDTAWFSAVPLLTAAATVTSSIRLGPLVTSPNFRHPVAFAREVTALDDISGGRLSLGVGAGGRGWDAQVLGQDPWSASERVGRFAEFVEILDRLLTEEELDYQGRYYSASGARATPGCVQRPRVPFVLAATGARAMTTVARWGQAWVTTGAGGGPDPIGPLEGAAGVAGQAELLDKACAALGRDPSELDRVVLLGPVLAQGLDSEGAFAGTLGAYEEVGMTDVIIHWPRPAEPYQGSRSVFERAVLSQLNP